MELCHYHINITVSQYWQYPMELLLFQVYTLFYKQPVYKQRGLNSDVLSNLAFTFS